MFQKQSGELPHLIQHLRREYALHLGKAATDPGAMDGVGADAFISWAAQYLSDNRTVENWPADANIGLRLSNNKRVLVHPATGEGTGQMQESGAVHVTKGQTQPGQEGVVQVTDQQRVI